MGKKVIGEIGKSHNERLRIEIKTYKGKEYLDIRTYFKDENGSWKPTKKGVTVPLGCMGIFSYYIHKAEMELEFKKDGDSKERRFEF